MLVETDLHSQKAQMQINQTLAHYDCFITPAFRFRVLELFWSIQLKARWFVQILNLYLHCGPHPLGELRTLRSGTARSGYNITVSNAGQRSKGHSVIEGRI